MISSKFIWNFTTMVDFLIHGLEVSCLTCACTGRSINANSRLTLFAACEAPAVISKLIDPLKLSVFSQD